MTGATRTIRGADRPFVELGVITYAGQDFAALGATESADGTRLVCYVDEARWTVGNWDGSVTFGRVVARRDYKVRTGFGVMPIRMRSLRVRRPDGTMWSGRYGYDWRSLVTLKAVAS